MEGKHTGRQTLEGMKACFTEMLKKKKNIFSDLVLFFIILCFHFLIHKDKTFSSEMQLEE